MVGPEPYLSYLFTIYLHDSNTRAVIERLREISGLGCFAGRALDRNLVMSSENFGT